MVAPNIAVRLTGTTRAIQILNEWSGATRRIQNQPLRIISRLPYAFGIETGYHRYGKLARRKGGAWYLRAARDKVRSVAARELGSAFLRGGTAVDQAWRELGKEGKKAAEAAVPVVSGALRGSIEVWVRTERIA